MNELTLVFKALSEPLRLRIVRFLLDRGREAYGEELARNLGVPAYRLSRHLKVLKATGLVHERRSGRWIYYSLPHTNAHLTKALRELITRARLERSNGNREPEQGQQPHGVTRHHQASVEPDAVEPHGQSAQALVRGGPGGPWHLRSPSEATSLPAPRPARQAGRP